MERIDTPLVAVIMGSRSDLPVMKEAMAVLEELGIAYEAKVISAHRTPGRAYEFASKAWRHGFRVIIAGAGGAAHLPGVTAALTSLPVIGVPIQSKALNGQDSLLSIVQMPAGIPVGTMAINGAKNAGLYAAAILALSNDEVRARLNAWRERQTESVPTTVED